MFFIEFGEHVKQLSKALKNEGLITVSFVFGLSFMNQLILYLVHTVPAQSPPPKFLSPSLNHFHFHGELSTLALSVSDSLVYYKLQWTLTKHQKFQSIFSECEHSHYLTFS